MKNGPVPSGVYTILTDVRDNSFVPLVHTAKETFQVIGYNVKPLRKCDTSFLSVSDLKCLDEAIKQCNTLPFSELIQKNHSELHPEVKPDQEIPIELIIKQLPNCDDVFDYLAG